MYIHNKGSYHPSETADVVRRLGTRAALSRACSPSGRKRYRCNACGLSFRLVLHLHYAGNMWSADCGYVRELLHPQVYTRVRYHLCPHLVLDAQTERSGDGDQRPHPRRRHPAEKHCFLNTSDAAKLISANGWHRFAHERWIASHPSLLPCLVYRGSYRHDFRSRMEEWKVRLERPVYLGDSPYGGTLETCAFHLDSTRYTYGHVEGYDDLARFGVCNVFQSDSRNVTNPCDDGEQRTVKPHFRREGFSTVPMMSDGAPS